jgi:hypothetical protein
MESVLAEKRAPVGVISTSYRPLRPGEDPRRGEGTQPDIQGGEFIALMHHTWLLHDAHLGFWMQTELSAVRMMEITTFAPAKSLKDKLNTQSIHG